MAAGVYRMKLMFVIYDQQFYIVMCFGLGGGAYKSDRYMVNYERRGRAKTLDEETKRRYEILYGDAVEAQKALEQA